MDGDCGGREWGNSAAVCCGDRAKASQSGAPHYREETEWLRLHVAAEELYPEDYDFSIIFDTVENRKLRHKMEKRHVEDEALTVEE